MAIWQFGINLISKKKIENSFEDHSSEINRENFYKLGFHQGIKLPDNFEIILNSISEERKHWCDKARIWGENDGNHIDVWNFFESSKVEVFSRLHVGDWNKSFVEKLLEFANLCECLLLTKNDSIIEPKMNLLIQEIIKSNSYRFCKFPIEYIESDEVKEINEEWQKKIGNTELNFLEPIKNVNIKIVEEIKEKLTE